MGVVGFAGASALGGAAGAAGFFAAGLIICGLLYCRGLPELNADAAPVVHV